MFIAAHIFAGALLGLAIWHLAGDRRAVPLCIAGSVLPDLLDKPLGLLVPSVFGGGRTVTHALIMVVIILLFCLIFARSSSRWLIGGTAGAVLLHQVADEMWVEPANWFWPLLGPFQGEMIPRYLWTYFWYEITNPSEWLFMAGTLLVLAQSRYLPLIPGIMRPGLPKTGAYTLSAVVFLATGLYLVAAGLGGPEATLIAPGYSGVPTVIAGVLALCGAFVMSRRSPRPVGS